MKALKTALLVAVLSLALCFALAIACGDDDDDDDDDDDEGHPGINVLSPSECDAVITQIYDVCQSDVNTWVRDIALEYCYDGGGAEWTCIQGCTTHFAYDCQAIFSCQAANCS